MEMSSLLTLNAIDRAIGGFLVGSPVQCHPNRKASAIISNNLDSGDGLTPWPLSNGIDALFSQSPVAHSDCFRFCHAAHNGQVDPGSRDHVVSAASSGHFTPAGFDLDQRRRRRFAPGGNSFLGTCSPRTRCWLGHKECQQPIRIGPSPQTGPVFQGIQKKFLNGCFNSDRTPCIE
jgi:hypothetical protein